MAAKKTFDMRGKQSSIARLASFDKEGFVHMLSYRILIFYSIIYGVLILASFVFIQLSPYVKWLSAAFWVLITPQLYETVKAFSLISSRGLSFGHLSKEYVFLMKSRYSKNNLVYTIIPYVAMIFWTIGFVALLLWWSI